MLRLAQFHCRRWKVSRETHHFDRPRVMYWTSTKGWSDSERHARNILGEEGFTRFMTSLSGRESEQSAKPAAHVAEPSPAYGPSTPGAQRRLFPGDPTLFGDPMEDHPPRGKRRG